MKVNREKLLSTLEMVAPGLSERDLLEQSSCYILKDKKIVTFNEEVACSYRSPLDETFQGAVQASPLRSILSKMTEETIEVRQTKSSLVINGKGKTSSITMEKNITLPMEALEPPKKWKEMPEKFADAVDFVQNCASRDAAQFHLTCIHIHPDFIEAFDNHQFARYNLKSQMSSEFLLRQSSIKNIVSLSMIESSETENWVHFRNAQKLVLSCRRYKDEYTNLDVITKKVGYKIVLPKGLMEASDRAEVFSADNSAQEDNLIQVDLKPGLVTVTGKGNFGSHIERKKITYEGDPITFLIKPKMMVQLAKDYRDCEVSKTALLVRGGNSIFVTSLTKPKEIKKKEKVHA